MSDSYTLTPEQEAFFTNGGNLPEDSPLLSVDDPVEVVDAPAPAPAPVPTPAPVPAPAPVDSAEDRYLERLHAQEAARAAELQGKISDLTKQLEALKAPPVPDLQTDPMGHLLHKLDTITSKLAELENKQSTHRQEDTQANEQQRFINAVNQQIADFTKAHPDYQAAYKHLRDAKFAELKGVGYTADEANQKLNQEELDITIRAMRSQKSPAEIAYSMAQRYGYKPPQSTTDPESKVEQIKKGLKAETPDNAGKPTAGTTTIETLKNASDADLNKLIDGDGWEKMFGVKGSKDIF